jgi:hypothetical protein
MTVPTADGKEPVPPATASATPETTTPKIASAETPAADGATPIMAAVESPPLAPTEPAPAIAPEVRADVREPVGEPASAETTSAIAPASLTGGLLPPLRMPKLSRRTRWRGMIAATIAFAAAVGAATGAVITGTRPPPPPAPAHDEFASSERAAMQKTIAKLTRDVTTLRANLEGATKSANTQLAKLNERMAAEKAAGEKQAERHAAAAAAQQDITGSVGTPAVAAVPVPTPRPVVQADAKADIKPDVKPVETRPAIVEGWSIRSVRDGIALIENRGEIYEVVPGAPLPGLGRVEAVRRQDGRWVVVTPKGLIVAGRLPAPRAYYERF